MDILFISDYVCPYCLVAKEALFQACDALGIKPNITWQPFELTPEPRERVDTYHDARRRAGYQILVEPCRQLGLDMKLPPKVIPRPYTRLAFEGWYYACENGRGEEYNSAVYNAYFIDERDIGQIDVLVSIAEAVGLDGAGFRQALLNGTYTAAEQAAVRYAREELKPRGVPTIYIDDRQIQLEQYTKAEMMRILNDASFVSMDAHFCGPDGC